MTKVGWGDRLKKARKGGNTSYSQEVFASLIGVAKSTLNDYEAENTAPDLGKLKAVFRVTGVTPNAIVLGEESPSPESIDFDILQSVLLSLEIDHPNETPETKARLAISLYKHQIRVKHKENETEVPPNVGRRKRVQGNSGHGQGGQ